MKTPLFAVVAGLALALPVWSDESAKLEIHEWGTFTVVSGSDGRSLQWYQPEYASTELPPFVTRTLPALSRGKNGPGTLRPGSGLDVSSLGPAASFVRMETPVIYFYPDKPLREMVSVHVKYLAGQFTELFPPGGGPQGEVTWVGKLFSPDDEESAKVIPKIEGVHGTHYGHAREVPAAWYFHASICSAPGAPQPREKFIFYRGAGDALPPFEAHAFDDHRMKICRFDQGDGPVVAFALQVENHRARWKRMPDLPGRGKAANSPAPISEVPLEKEPLLPLVEVSEQLGSAMKSELIAAGLSPDEAKAMVATWSDSWFRESGSRIFALLPRTWVDSVLSLEITPKPEKVARVFVGSFETFTSAQENSLLALLSPQNTMDAAARSKFKDLHLGRFSYAALQRAHNLMNMQFQILEASTPCTTAAR